MFKLPWLARRIFFDDDRGGSNRQSFLHTNAFLNMIITILKTL